MDDTRQDSNDNSSAKGEADRLPGKIRQWLDKSGYAFELSVGRAAASLGWSVSHARYDLTPES